MKPTGVEDATKEQILNGMDAAATQAFINLSKIKEGMSAAEQKGAEKFLQWYKDSIATAGYKRLGKGLKIFTFTNG